MRRFTVQLDNGKKSLKKDFELLVRNRNIAGEATAVLSECSQMNEAVMDSCWYTSENPCMQKLLM